MIDRKLPNTNKEARSSRASCDRQRIDYCVKIFQNFLRFSGIVLIIVQLVKAVESISQSDNISLSIIVATIIGLLLLIVSSPKLLSSAVVKLAARSRRNFDLYIYIFPILLTMLLLFIKIKAGYDSDYWRAISDEGGLSEYGTAIAYLLTAVFAYPIAKQFWRQRKRIMALLYFLLTIGSVFVSMEEISWGQRLIGFEEPEFWVKHNAQAEFTFHNLGFFHEYLLDQSFLVAGFLGSFSWIALHYWQKRQQQSSAIDFSYILPGLSISSFFYPTFIFYIIHIYTDKLGFFLTKDQEHCEFIMSLGILLFVIINFLRQSRKSEDNI